MTYQSYRDNSYDIQPIKSLKDKEFAILLEFSHFLLILILFYSSNENIKS